MFGKKNLFKLDISNVEFWQRYQDTENNNFNELYRKQVCDKGTLLLDKIGNPKGMPKTNGCYYMDLVTGRVVSFCLTEDQEHFIILPSMVVVPKDRLVQADNHLYSDAADILVNSDMAEEYTKTSEEILYESCFCNFIATWQGIDKIPASSVQEEIKKARVGAHEDKKLAKKVGKGS